MVKRIHGWFFFFNDTATTEIYTLSLHDALPIWPLVGYAMIVFATALGGVNATVGKVVLVAGGLGANRFTELRATGAAILLVAALALLHGRRALPARRELPFLALFGVVGLALAQFTYFRSEEHT